ncbi:hypothetical protein IHE45_04G049600 [Dioscorea alata]|uniref:Uncharacterized protein n=1 Tax=Dioscorea alata TaxID=55571 RepID=A0ACB7WCD4_DIOAL|nr:hypothetical protein IHE45_04G049600 [Dioscorea alata]
MPPAMDHDNLFNNGDNKVACETLVVGCGSSNQDPPPTDEPDLPAESYRIRIEDWFRIRSAAVFDREYSTKGSTNPKSMMAHSNRNSSSTSQRLSANSKSRALIIGLPNKVDLAGYLRRPLNSREVRRSAPSLAGVEPESPKVSCFGRISSEREQGAQRGSEQKPDASVGCWAGFPTVFGVWEWWRKGSKVVVVVEEEKEEKVGIECSDKDQSSPAAEVMVMAMTMTAPGLGGMERFSSGRRPESWGRALDVGPGEHVAR